MTITKELELRGIEFEQYGEHIMIDFKDGNGKHGQINIEQIDGVYTLNTCKQKDDYEASNEKDVKSIKAVLTYLRRFIQVPEQKEQDDSEETITEYYCKKCFIGWYDPNKRTVCIRCDSPNIIEK